MSAFQFSQDCWHVNYEDAPEDGLAWEDDDCDRRVIRGGAWLFGTGDVRSARRECLDWLIPLSESHLCLALQDWQAHYNGSRPDMALGPGVPDPPTDSVVLQANHAPHRIGEQFAVRARSVLGGLHHEYSLGLSPA